MEPKLTRRDLLGWAAVGAAGILVPTIVRAKPRPVVFDMGKNRKSEMFTVRVGNRAFQFDGFPGIFLPTFYASNSRCSIPLARSIRSRKCFLAWSPASLRQRRIPDRPHNRLDESNHERDEKNDRENVENEVEP